MQQHITLQIYLSPDISRIDQINQQLPPNQHNPHSKILYALCLGIYIHLRNPAILKSKGIVKSLIIGSGLQNTLRYLLLIVGHRDVSPGGNMRVNQCFEVKIHHNVGIRQNHIFFFLIL